MIGIRGPRRAVQGTMFAGRVVAVGAAVTRYAVGDDVFGGAMRGAYAEYLAVREDGAMAKLPAGIGYDQAAAVPYGGVTALRYLRDVGRVQPGEKVLILGAAGGVGRFAVQIARHLGAEVTAVCSRDSFELVRGLGAHHLLDYRTDDWRTGQYDIIFDCADATKFARARRSLTRRGRYLSLYVSVGLVLAMLGTAITRRRRAKMAVAMGRPADLEQLAEWLAAGVIRPTLGARFALDQIAEAHASVQRHASVIVTPVPARA
jgi:NADPH:quinone reductase-like Zn-dependent oxidoreductase